MRIAFAADVQAFLAVPGPDPDELTNIRDIEP